MSNSYLSEVKCVRCRELENEEEQEDLINKARGEWPIQKYTVLRALHHIGRVGCGGIGRGDGIGCLVWTAGVMRGKWGG